MLDGSSEHVAHVWTETSNCISEVICLHRQQAGRQISKVCFPFNVRNAF